MMKRWSGARHYSVSLSVITYRPQWSCRRLCFYTLVWICSYGGGLEALSACWRITTHPPVTRPPLDHAPQAVDPIHDQAPHALWSNVQFVDRDGSDGYRADGYCGGRHVSYWSAWVPFVQCRLVPVYDKTPLPWIFVRKEFRSIPQNSRNYTG